MVFAKGSVEKQTKEEIDLDDMISWKILEDVKNGTLNCVVDNTVRDHQYKRTLTHAEDMKMVPFLNPNQYFPVHEESDPCVCDLCGDCTVVSIMSEGNYVCQTCGYVNVIPIYIEHKSLNDNVMNTVLMHSSYKRIHYCNERIHQWLCRDHWLLPPSDLNLLRSALTTITPPQQQQLLKGTSPFVPGTVTTTTYISKSKIRNALRSIGKPELVERWVTILCQLSKTHPPSPDCHIVQTMRELFAYVEIAFNIHKPKDRKSMIHYNFVFVRILQFLEQPQFYRFFPLLKSRAKVRSIDAVWHKIAEYLGWKYLPLPNAKAFKM